MVRARKQTEMHRLLAMYENFVSLTVSRPTAARYCKSLEGFFDRFPDKTRPNEFTRHDVEDWRIIRLREGIAPSTLNYDVAVLRTFWRWMMDMEATTWNPAAQVRRLKYKEPPRKSLSVTDQLKLKEGVFCWADQALLALALSTGLRGTTLAALEKSEIDFENKRLIIPAEKMKAGRNHEIPLMDWVLDILKEAPDGRIFEGYARNLAGIHYRWNKICRRVGIAPTGIRTARRTFATTLLRTGADLGIVQAMLGHRNISTTSRYLTPADADTVRKAVDKLPCLTP